MGEEILAVKISIIKKNRLNNKDTVNIIAMDSS